MEFLSIDIRTILLSITTTINLLLASLIYLRSKEKSTIFFVLSIMSVAVWSFGIMMYTQEGIHLLTSFWSNINYGVSTSIALGYFFFAYFFTREFAHVPQWFIVFTVLFQILVLTLILSPGFDPAVVSDFVLVDGVKQEIFGWGYPIYVLFIILYFFGGITLFIRRFFTSEGVVRNQIKFILLGTGIAIVFGITTNVLLPSAHLSQLVWLGPIGTLVMVSLISYAISRHKLWDFKLIAIQFFIALIVLAILLQVLVADTVFEQAIKGGIFVLTLISAFILIRGLLHDVAQREHLEELTGKLQDANKRLHEIDIEKSDFVSITSHQFRTPLTVIKGYTSMLLEGSFGNIHNRKIKEAVDEMYRASERLVLIIEEFLNISRIEKNEMKYSFQKVDLRDVVAIILRNYKKTLAEQKLHITFTADREQQFAVLADAGKTRQVIENVIDNAIKYTKPGGAIIIMLTKNEKKGTIVFSIQDTGIGIPASMMSRLFEKFSRAKGMSKLHTEGRGLGLYVAKQIMQGQSGNIWAESKGKDQGSTFYLEFPNWDTATKRREISTLLAQTV